jgi:hypothetical protein
MRGNQPLAFRPTTEDADAGFGSSESVGGRRDQSLVSGNLPVRFRSLSS